MVMSIINNKKPLIIAVIHRWWKNLNPAITYLAECVDTPSVDWNRFNDIVFDWYEQLKDRIKPKEIAYKTS